MVVPPTADTSSDWSREKERGLHRAQDQRDGINSLHQSKGLRSHVRVNAASKSWDSSLELLIRPFMNPRRQRDAESPD
jgi:hypothetical protein